MSTRFEQFQKHNRIIHLIINYQIEEKHSKGMSTQISLKQTFTKAEVKRQEPFLKQYSKLRNGHWKRLQTKRYIEFMRKYYFIMRSSLLRYHYKIFLTMADYIGTRNAVQCKSHHQKMLKKYNFCLQKIIFSERDLRSPILIGEGLEGNHIQAVKKGTQNIETSEKLPFFIIRSQQKLLIVVDDRYIQNY